MKCEFCDSPLQPGVANCPGCGAAQSVVPPTAAAHPTLAAPVHQSIPLAQEQHGPLKSRVAAGLLAIFLAGLGIHNFYLGYTGKGLTQLLISVLSCGYLWLFMAIWELIEGILLLAIFKQSSPGSGEAD